MHAMVVGMEGSYYTFQEVAVACIGTLTSRGSKHRRFRGIFYRFFQCACPRFCVLVTAWRQFEALGYIEGSKGVGWGGGMNHVSRIKK
jgi:hypothetical protein